MAHRADRVESTDYLMADIKRIENNNKKTMQRMGPGVLNVEHEICMVMKALQTLMTYKSVRRTCLWGISTTVLLTDSTQAVEAHFHPAVKTCPPTTPIKHLAFITKIKLNHGNL